MHEYGRGRQGPSCVCVPGGLLRSRDKGKLENLYNEARAAHNRGWPTLDDTTYDVLEARLRAMESDVVRKYPRCSLRGKRVFSDAAIDSAQRGLLAGVWGAFFTVATSVAFRAGGPKNLLLCSSLVRGDGPGQLRNQWEALVFLGAAFVAGVSWASMRGAVNGENVAVRGECPNCASEVSEFVDRRLASEGGSRNVVCHVCGNRLSLKLQQSPRLDALSGKFYLASGQ